MKQRPFIPGLPWNKSAAGLGGLLRQLPTGDWVLDPGTGVDTASGTYLLTGATITWVSGYTYQVGAASYYIDGTLYSSIEQTVALDAADGTYDRIDVLVLDTTGTLGKVTGDPAANPAEPVVDPSVYLRLGIVVVSAGSSTPTVTTTTIWDENTGGDWTASTSGSGFTIASTSNPYSGTKDIELTNVAAGSYVLFTKPSGTIDIAAEDNFFFYIRLKASWPSQKGLVLSWLDASSVIQGVSVTVKNGNYGFSRSLVGSYQQIVIPKTAFGVPSGALTTKLKVAVTGGGGSVGGYLDLFQLQVGSGGVADPGTNPWTWRGAWSSATTYRVNDVVSQSNATYLALLPSTNQDPTTATTYWVKLGVTVASGGGGLNYQGTWNATTNSPTIPAAASGNNGYYYYVATAGTTTIDGISDWQVGDWIISNGTTWQKIDNSDIVTSVFGRTGTVVPVAGDYDETKGGTGQTSYAVGDLLYASAINVLSKLAANTAATRKFLKMVSSVPSWDTFVAGDLPDNNRDAWAVLIVGDGSATLTTGLVVGAFYLAPGTIIKAAIYSTLDETGSINADIIADSLGAQLTYPGDKISASDPIVISAAKFGENTSLTGWTTATTGSGAGKLGRLYINSVSGFTQILLLIQVRR